MGKGTKVIKNTIFLYVKMVVVILMELISIRIILSALGDEDFGIFNVVGGTIAMLGFLNSTMANATNRFMSYAEGEGNSIKKKQIFNISIILHALIAVCTASVLLGIMPILFNNVLTIPESKIFAAKIVYLLMIVSSSITIVNVPYDAVMNTHENMLYYSIMGIFEAILKLGAAVSCMFVMKDKLIVYGIAISIIPLITLTIMKIYCHKHYQECILAPIKYWNFSLLKDIASFSGWNFLTACSSLVTVQGLGIVLNHFWGATYNAAQAIGNKFNGLLNQFASNLMKSLNPVIIKSAGAKKSNDMTNFTLLGCKYSTLVCMLFGIPFMLEMHYLLSVWLTSTPAWAIAFCNLQIINIIIVQLTNTAATSVYAKGNIKSYAIFKSITNLLPIIITSVLFYMHASPYWTYIPMIIVGSIGGGIVIMYYSNKFCQISTTLYFKRVLCPIILVGSMMFISGHIVVSMIEESALRLILTCCITTIALSVFTFLSMKKQERMYTREIILKAASTFIKRMKWYSI